MAKAKAITKTVTVKTATGAIRCSTAGLSKADFDFQKEMAKLGITVVLSGDEIDGNSVSMVEGGVLVTPKDGVSRLEPCGTTVVFGDKEDSSVEVAGEGSSLDS
jgi:hypothetical protein